MLKLSAQKDATIDYLKQRLTALNVDEDETGSLKSKLEKYSNFFSDEDLLKLTAVQPSTKGDHTFTFLVIEMLYRDSMSVPILSQRHGRETMSTKDCCMVKDMLRIRAKHFANDDLDYLARSQESAINRTLSNALSCLRQKKNKKSSVEELDY